MAKSPKKKSATTTYRAELEEAFTYLGPVLLLIGLMSIYLALVNLQ